MELASGLNSLTGSPRNARAGILLTTVAALALLASGSEALTEDDPVARAPLPPPLRSATDERQMYHQTLDRDQSGPTPPVADRPRTEQSQRGPARTLRRTGAPGAQESEIQVAFDETRLSFA